MNRLHRSLSGILLVLVAGGGCRQLRGDEIEYLSYNVTLNSGITGVSDLLFIDHLAVNGPGWTWPYSLSAGNSTATQIWLIDNSNFPPVTSAMAIGLATDLPGDPAGVTTTHLVVFGDFTPSEIGESFTTLFPDANENTLIYDLENILGTTVVSTEEAITTFDDDVLPLYDDADSLGMLTSPGGTFDAVAFTDGQLIGTGTLKVTYTAEPASAGLLGLALAVALLWRRRLRRA